MESKQFVTNVGLITSNGPFGDNVMACEWTHQLSYDPFLIMVGIRPNKATFANIQESKEFGVNLAAFDQNWVASIAGNNSAKSINKISVLEQLGVSFYQAEKIKTLMIQGASMNAECKLIKFLDLGDHPLLIGSALTVVDHEKKPLIYQEGKYWQHGEQIQKPDAKTLARFALVIDKYLKR